ncbi:hypothetical protein A0H81_03751 [Grifola frondosa]|uniref:N-acetyltransferase domain-containing protein n=1 Tax=Grifola frondosa TaxID=5627 RepID=A0A1C7MJN3_GRIFR|nr:hypothetical protein A0H81_03751 [Grifola frondosa]
MQQYPWFLAHDNLNFRFRVFEQRVDHHSHFDSGTAGTVFIIKNPSAVPPTSAAFQAHRAVGCKSPLSSMDIVKLDMAAAPRLASHAVNIILQFLLDAPNFSFDTYSQKDSSWLKPPPRPGQLKTERTQRRSTDIPKAARSAYNALRDVDLTHCYEDVPNAGSPIFREWRQKIILSLNYGNAIRRHHALTVIQVKQIVTSKESPDVIDRIVDYIVRFLRLFTTDEQKKRRQEFSMKVSALVRSALGDRVADMIEIHSLATSPAKQGRGYGSALVNTVTARVFDFRFGFSAG